MRIVNLLVFIAACVAPCAASAENPPFPRLAGVNIGLPHNYDDPEYQSQLARLHMSVLAAYPGWEKGKKSTLEHAVRRIKARNPDTRVFLYINSMEVPQAQKSFREVYDKVDEMGWWLFERGDSGAKLQSAFGKRNNKPTYQVNTTLFTPKDSKGQQHWEWHAHWVVQKFYKPNPSIDGFFEDNVFWRPRVDGDWNRDGVLDAKTSPAAAQWLREGYRARFALLHKLMPGKYVIGNLGEWGQKNATITELEGALEGGIIEGLLGTHYSPEKYASWAEMMRAYRKTMNAVAPPRLVVFHQQGEPHDYQAMRYGLASCLLDDGYYAFTDKSKGYSGVTWFDEFDVKLGRALDGPALKPWKNGVYRREFEHGVVLVNPKGNGAQSLAVDAGFVRIKGKQAPHVNDGKPAETVLLQDRDGLILLRAKSTRGAET